MTPFLTAEWRHLLVMSFPVDPALLGPWLPSGTELDAFEGVSYVSFVGLEFVDTRVLGLASPFHRDFEEVNLRFYVRREHNGETRRGVVFVKEIVRSRLIAAIARLVYGEPYHSMPTRQFRGGRERGLGLGYEWHHRGRRHRMGAVVDGAPEPLEPGSVEFFLTERRWGYTRDRGGRTREYRVDHAPWRIWRPSEIEFDCDVTAVYGAIGCAIGGAPPSAFVAEGSPITVHRGNVLPTA